MSSVRGGGSRGRGRGSGQRGASRGPSTTSGGLFRGNVQRGQSGIPGSFAQAPRQNALSAPRRASTTSNNNAFHPPRTTTSLGAGSAAKGSWQDRYQVLTKARERERANAIRQGLIADKPRSLADAITPVGTCQDMCAEYERVERVVVKDVWAEETDPNHSVYSTVDREPDEARMVKKFRRAAAGLEQQLPSDLRPPHVLKRTCDYLFDEVVGNAPALERVHHFIWDRTRAIRNDFSIQQIAKLEELSIAVDCYERIARFHIVSLHQLAVQPKPYDKYDAQQEREQLDRTLLSLMQYYDDSRGRIHLPNEAEFRAYCVVFQMQDPSPDLEDRVQTWPDHIVRDRRVQTALQLYAAACNTMDPQGPLKPRANHLLAQQDWARFWTSLASKHVSYLMACVAEVYFNLVRRTALSALLRAFKVNPNKAEQDWTPDVLCNVLAFDDHDKVYTFCEAYGFSFSDREDGEQYLDLTSVREKTLPQPDVNLPKQWKSELVESKRFGRSLPAVIRGLSVKQAQDAGMTSLPDDNEEEMEDSAIATHIGLSNTVGPFADDPNDEDSLFMPENGKQSGGQSAVVAFGTTGNSFGTLSDKGKDGPPASTGFTFGKPSSSDAGMAPTGGSTFNASPASNSVASGTKFNFLSNGATPVAQAANPVPAPSSTTAFGFSKFEPGKFSFAHRSDGVAPVAAQTTTSAPAAPPATPFGFPKFEPGRFSFGPGAHNDAKTKIPNGNSQPGPFQHDGSDENSFAQTPPKPASIPIDRKPSDRIDFSSSNGVNGHHPASVDLSPTSPQQVPASGHVSANLTSAQRPPEVKSTQLHSTTTAQSPTSIPATAAATSAHRKSSLPDNKPKIPSPLANSFNANGDYTSAKENGIFSNIGGKPTVKEPSLNALSQHPRVDAGARLSEHIVPSEPPKETFESIVRRLAHEITHDGFAGFVKQYVDFAVEQTIKKVQAELEEEHLNARADNFRVEVLAHRYGKRWRDRYWAKRLASRGRARRERARKGLEEHKRSLQSQNTGDVGHSTFDRVNLVFGETDKQANKHHAMADDKPQYADRQTSRASMEQHSTTSSKRPPSSRNLQRTTAGNSSGHKRLQSTSHLDAHGRIAKPAPPANSTADLLKRSSFLGFSLGPDAVSRDSATRSNYFRLKAMGMNPSGESGGLRGTKRRRSNTIDAPTGTPSTGLDMSQLFKSKVANSPHTPSMPPPPPIAKANEVDEALFARLAAARASLAETTTFMKSSLAGEGAPVESTGPRASSESPSMARARAEARLRLSNGSSDNLLSSSDSRVPAYRLRESRFVPREQYGRAVERAKEMRQSRSREASRPGSRAAFNTTSVDDSVPEPELQPEGVGAITPTVIGLSSRPAEEQASVQVPAATSSSNFSHSVAQSQDVENSSRSTPGRSVLPTFTPQPTFGTHHSKPAGVRNDYTVDPSQVEQSLSNSFGNHSWINQPPLRASADATNLAPQQGSYMHSQGFSFSPTNDVHGTNTASQQPNSYLYSQTTSAGIDDEDVLRPNYIDRFAQGAATNGIQAQPGDDEILEPSSDDGLGASHSHINPYAALADEQGGEGDGFDAQSGEAGRYDTDAEIDPDLFGGDDEDEAGADRRRNGYSYHDQNGYDADDYGDGDIEDAEEYDDEDDEDDLGEDAEGEGGPISMHQRFARGEDFTQEGEEEEEEEEDTISRWGGRKLPVDNTPKNPALQHVGHSVEEAIELSD